MNAIRGGIENFTDRILNGIIAFDARVMPTAHSEEPLWKQRQFQTELDIMQRKMLEGGVRMGETGATVLAIPGVVVRMIGELGSRITDNRLLALLVTGLGVTAFLAACGGSAPTAGGHPTFDAHPTLGPDNGVAGIVATPIASPIVEHSILVGVPNTFTPEAGASPTTTPVAFAEYDASFYGGADSEYTPVSAGLEPANGMIFGFPDGVTAFRGKNGRCNLPVVPTVYSRQFDMNLDLSESGVGESGVASYGTGDKVERFLVSPLCGKDEKMAEWVAPDGTLYVVRAMGGRVTSFVNSNEAADIIHAGKKGVTLKWESGVPNGWKDGSVIAVKDTPPAAETITLAPFTVETKSQIPVLNVPDWVKANGGEMITPGDIMDGTSQIERPFPSDTLVTGFWIQDQDDGSKMVSVIIDGKIKNVSELPFVYDTVMLTDAQALYPELFAKLSEKWGVPLNKLLAVKLRINTVGGELEMVMVTSGDKVYGTNGASDASAVIERIAGPDFKVPALPIVKNLPDTNKTADILGSRLAGEIMEEQGIEIKTLGELMVSTDLNDPEQFNKLQEELRGTWFILGGIDEVKDVKAQK